MTFSFRDDYSEGVHPEILKYIHENNDGQALGYGRDESCLLATERIVREVGADADVHFVTGGTHANLIGVSSMLKSYEAAVSALTGHLNSDEAGAIEATGHKVLGYPSPDGKLTEEMIDLATASHHDEHNVIPRVAYLTIPTELGANFVKEEFFSVVKYAKDKGLYVYVDGARLAMALGHPNAQLHMSDLAKAGVDMFYIGGTKVGGMFGEAIVIVNDELRTNFRYHLKQRGAVIAKQRYMGLQFVRFFAEDNLWLSLGRKSVENAMLLAEGLQDIGVQFARKPESNMIFPIFELETIERLRKDFSFHSRGPIDDKSEVVRLGCSWATPVDQIEAFIKAVPN